MQQQPSSSSQHRRLNQATIEDLRKSGLSSETISEAQISDFDGGFRIPYFDVDLEPTEFYRRRLFDSVVRYKQAAGTNNHIYFPPNLPPLWKHEPTILITEGEKKALKACQEGFSCIALGGVWSWRGTAPEADDLSFEASVQRDDPTAEGLRDINWEGKRVIIVFDNDRNPRARADVQRAAFELALWLEFAGAESVGQFHLPINSAQKMGLDDYFLEPQNVEAFRSALATAEFSFPHLTQPKQVIARSLQKRTNRRQNHWKAARAVISHLDYLGRRYVDDAGNNYYFDRQTLVLHRFLWSEVQQSSFGALLVQRYGIRSSDRDLMMDLGSMFAAFEPCPTIVPHRVISSTPEAIYFQVSDSKIARVQASGITLLDNGSDGQLFLSGSVEPLELEALRSALTSAQAGTHRGGRQTSHTLSELDGPHGRSGQGQVHGSPSWLQILESVNLQPLGPLSLLQTRQLMCCMFYMSPWLLRWRATQLPLEVAVAEPNSGKTFLYNLRKGILTGNPSLQGMPPDFRSFVSSVQSANGLWVCDNLGHLKNDYWEQLNSELARIITDPDPYIELRQLYTTSDLARIPIQCSFAITCIRNPLTKPDLIQRSLIFELQAIPAGQRNSNWYTRHMAKREALIVEHLQVLQEFLKLASTAWVDDYLSGYRLVNFEQCLRLMGQVLGFDMAPIVACLPNLVTSTILDSDIIIQGLKQFADENPGQTVQVSDIVSWAQVDPSGAFDQNNTLTNPILLGRYIKSHLDDIQHTTGIRYERKNNTTFMHIPQLELGQ